MTENKLLSRMQTWWQSERGRGWRFSNSQFQMFGRCRAAWELAYVQRVTRSSHPAAKFGTAIHEIIAKAFKRWLKEDEARTMNPEDFTLPDGLPKALLLEGVPSDRASEKNAYYLLEALCDVDGRQFDPKRTYGVETKFVMDLKGLPVPILGYIDRLDNDPVRVIDYKTGRTPGDLDGPDGVVETTPTELSQNEDTADLAHQLQMYALVASVIFPDVQEIGVEAWFLKSGIRIRAVVGRGEIEDMEKEFALEGVKILEEREFPYTVGSHCGWCDVRNSCPEFYRGDLLKKPGEPR